MKKYLLPVIIAAIGFSQTTFAELTTGSMSNKTKITVDLNVVQPSILENSLELPDTATTETLGQEKGKGTVTVRNGVAARLALAVEDSTGTFRVYAKGHEGDEKYLLWYGAYFEDYPNDFFKDTDYNYWVTKEPQTRANYEVIFSKPGGAAIKPGDIQPGVYPITTIAAVYNP